MGEQGEQRGDRVGDGAGRVAGADRSDGVGRHPSLRSTVVQELGVEVGDDRSAGAHDAADRYR